MMQGSRCSVAVRGATGQRKGRPELSRPGQLAGRIKEAEKRRGRRCVDSDGDERRGARDYVCMCVCVCVCVCVCMCELS